MHDLPAQVQLDKGEIKILIKSTFFKFLTRRLVKVFGPLELFPVAAARFSIDRPGQRRIGIF